MTEPLSREELEILANWTGVQQHEDGPVIVFPSDEDVQQIARSGLHYYARCVELERWQAAMLDVIDVARLLADATDNAERNATPGDLYNALAALDRLNEGKP